jgi:hypothetical protein
MKKFLIILICFLNLSTFAQKDELYQIRKEYRTANKDSLSCAKLYNKMAGMNNGNNIMNGYKGAVTMMYAEFIKDKAEKLRLVKKGRDILESAIAKDKENPELRLLRFTIQTNAPKILGYNKELDADKNLILQKYDTIQDQEVKTSIRSFLLLSGRVTASEKEKLK